MLAFLSNLALNFAPNVSVSLGRRRVNRRPLYMTRNNESTLERFYRPIRANPRVPLDACLSARRVRPSRAGTQAASASAPTSRVSGTGGGDSGLARLLAARARARPVEETRDAVDASRARARARMARGRRRARARARVWTEEQKRARRNRNRTGPTRDSRETRALDFRSPQNRPPRRYYSLLFIVVDGASTPARPLASTSYKTRVCPRGARSRPPFPGSLEKKRDQLSKGKNPPHDAHLTFLRPRRRRRRVPIPRIARIRAESARASKTPTPR